MPTSRDMAIFVLTMITTTTRPIILPLAHARGIIMHVCTPQQASFVGTGCATISMFQEDDVVMM